MKNTLCVLFLLIESLLIMIAAILGGGYIIHLIFPGIPLALAAILFIIFIMFSFILIVTIDAE